MNNGELQIGEFWSRRRLFVDERSLLRSRRLPNNIINIRVPDLVACSSVRQRHSNQMVRQTKLLAQTYDMLFKKPSTTSRCHVRIDLLGRH
jgi:hypothetical protein